VGLRLQAESWFDLSARSFISVDAAYGTAFQEYWSLARYGYRLRPWLAMGVEGGLLGKEEYDAGRGGGFFRFNLLATELTVSGGFTGNYLEVNRAAICPPASIAASITHERGRGQHSKCRRRHAHHDR
jgi:hypothetical protein